jgi:anti-sigma B factor antagonist
MSRTSGSLFCVESSGGVLLVTVASRQLRDVAGAARFERELRELAEAHPEPRWLLDFGGVTFFITPAANALVRHMRRLRQHGGDLALTGVNADVRYILRLVGLDDIFTIYSSVAEAQLDLLRSAAGSSEPAAEVG